MSVHHSTVAGNTGAGIFADNDGVVSLRSSIVAGNRDTSDTGYLDCRLASLGTLTSDGYNVTGAGTGCPGGGTGDQTVTPASVFTTVLVPLGDNGGPTRTHALIGSGPAVDTGTCTDASGAAVLMDQRGAPRPAGATCDIGAYEHDSKPLEHVHDIAAEPAGANCPYGGHRVSVGRDVDHNGVLDAGEVETSFYVCNDAPGGGDGGSALIDVAAEPAGENCTAGGSVIRAGVDDDGDGVLGADEIDRIEVVCHDDMNGHDGEGGCSAGSGGGNGGGNALWLVMLAALLAWRRAAAIR